MIYLECSICKNRNYRIQRGTEYVQGKRTRLEVKKHCKYCLEHTIHKESV